MIKNMKIKLLTMVYCGIALSGLATMFTMPVFADADKESIIVEARKSVEEFCRAEFSGDEYNQRVKLIKYSPAREKMEKKRTGPASAWVIFWDWDPYYVVSAYKIVNVDVIDGKAEATVEYKQLAASKGKEEIVPSVANDIVTLNMVYDGKQWWIFDPPLPRISKSQLVKIYENKLRRFDEKWLATASDEQKKSYARSQHALKVLISLSN